MASEMMAQARAILIRYVQPGTASHLALQGDGQRLNYHKVRADQACAAIAEALNTRAPVTKEVRESVHWAIRSTLVGYPATQASEALMDGISCNGSDGDSAGTLYEAFDRMADAAIAALSPSLRPEEDV